MDYISSAYHEAGHVVVAWHTLPREIIGHVEIVEAPSIENGFSVLLVGITPESIEDCFTPQPTYRQRLKLVEGQAQAYLAGSVAERIYIDKKNPVFDFEASMDSGGGMDIYEALQLTEMFFPRWSRGKRFNWLRVNHIIAVKLCRRWWDQIEVIASALLENRRVEKEQLAELLSEGPSIWGNSESIGRGA